jgi:acyl-coenzyme A synthetase/AMP-(fatty) acid ligase
MNSPFKIYNRAGELQNWEVVSREYHHIRQYLLDQHSGDKRPVVIRQTKDYRYFLTIIACMELGMPYIPVKADYPADRLGQIKEDSHYQVVLDDELMQKMLSYEQVQKNEPPAVSPADIMYVMFTSGSTGRPKGVIIQRQALENFFIYLKECFPRVNESDRLLQVTEFTFDISLVDVGMFLTKNVEVYFSNFENNIFKMGFEIDTHRISFLNTVPNNLNMFLSDMVAERMDYHCLKHLFIAGARFSHGLYEKCKKYFKPDVDVYNLYGPTESTVYSHGHHLSYEEDKDCVEGVVSIGKVLPNVKAHIVADGKILGPREKGELFIGGVQLLKEYINNPEQTQKSLVKLNEETFYKSGDLAFRTEDDQYFVVGRNDDTIKYRGFRINLLDIDSYITRLPYVQDSVTIAIPNELTENQTIGFIILKEEKTLKEVKQDMAKLLLDFQIPEKIFFVKSYPTNVSGKVDRKALREQYLSSLEKASP